MELVDIITVIEDLTLNLEKDFVSNVFVAKNISLLDYYFVFAAECECGATATMRGVIFLISGRRCRLTPCILGGLERRYC